MSNIFYNPDDLLVEADIARLVGLSRERIRQLATKRERNINRNFPLPCYEEARKNGKKRFWRYEDIADWIILREERKILTEQKSASKRLEKNNKKQIEEFKELINKWQHHGVTATQVSPPTALLEDKVFKRKEKNNIDIHRQRI